MDFKKLPRCYLLSPKGGIIDYLLIPFSCKFNSKGVLIHRKFMDCSSKVSMLIKFPLNCHLGLLHCLSFCHHLSRNRSLMIIYYVSVQSSKVSCYFFIF